jgi:hypothetical protein
VAYGRHSSRRSIEFPFELCVHNGTQQLRLPPASLRRVTSIYLCFTSAITTGYQDVLDRCLVTPAGNRPAYPASDLKVATGALTGIRPSGMLSYGETYLFVPYFLRISCAAHSASIGSNSSIHTKSICFRISPMPSNFLSKTYIQWLGRIPVWLCGRRKHDSQRLGASCSCLISHVKELYSQPAL